MPTLGIRMLAWGVALGLLLASAAPALAGGWAVTTLDTLPAGGLRAGETYRLGYTIRRHGQTPFDGATTEIRARLVATGEMVRFLGVPADGRGRYVAEVHFPAEGEWTWLVTQEPFAPQELGSLSVLPPLAEASEPRTVPVSRPSAGPVLAGLLAVLALGLLSATRVIFQEAQHVGVPAQE